MNIIIKLLIAAALLAGCSNPVEPDKPYSVTTPIAEGNTWVYGHYFRYDDRADYYDIDSNGGLFTVSMDSVSSRNDSVFFRLSTVDSGLSRKPKSNYVIPQEYTYSTYDIHDTDRFLQTGSGLFKMDMAGLWQNSDWSFLTFLIKPGTGSSTVMVNGGNTSTLYKNVIFNFNYGTMQWDIMRDTTKWLGGIGLYQSCYERDINLPSENVDTVNRYSLVSFDGSPVTISQ